MSTALYQSPIFGPIQSRRLGLSLGINLLPVDGKICSFDCVYCECGVNTEHRSHSRLPSREEVASKLQSTLIDMRSRNILPNTLTFSGNGEPTMHPDFYDIVQDTISLRNKYAPDTKISVLSNATNIHKDKVFQALLCVDNALLKLDTVDLEYIRLVDRPTCNVCLPLLIDRLSALNGKCIIQTMFLKGSVNGIEVDNTKDCYVNPWIETLKIIRPKMVTIYTIDRDTPIHTLEKTSREDLDHIASLLTEANITCSVSY